MKPFFMTTIAVLAFSVLFWTMLFYYSQGKSFEIKPNSFFRSNFEIIAHRGGGLEAPENTMVAFEKASKISENIIFEFDVHWTKDQKIVIMHDDDIKRTTNMSGPIKSFTLEELKKLDAAWSFKDEKGEYSFRGKGVQIPTLEEVFDKFPNIRMIIEIKPNDRDLAKSVYELIKKYDRIQSTILTSEHGAVVAYARSLDPNLLTNAPKNEMLKTVLLHQIHLEKLDPMLGDALCIPEKSASIQVLTTSLLNEAHRRGKKVYIWTVDDEKDMRRLIHFNVDGIITNRPKALDSLLSKLN